MASIVLIGLMGAGKTTVGRLLAARLDLPCVDSDVVIEERTGRSVPELFAEHGEAGFRRLEAEVVGDLVAGERLVLSLGGGAVTTEAVRTGLRGHEVVWLRARPSTLVNRLGPDEIASRPLLAGGAATALARLDDERAPYHRAVATLTIDVDGLAPEEVVDHIAVAVAPA